MVEAAFGPRVPLIRLTPTGRLVSLHQFVIEVKDGDRCARCVGSVVAAISRGGETALYCARHTPVRLDRPDVPNDYVPYGARWYYGAF